MLKQIFPMPIMLIKGNQPIRGPSRTKFWSSDFCFAPKLNLGIDNFKKKKKIRNFPTSGSFIPMSSKIPTVSLYDPTNGIWLSVSVR